MCRLRSRDRKAQRGREILWQRGRVRGLIWRTYLINAEYARMATEQDCCVSVAGPCGYATRSLLPSLRTFHLYFMSHPILISTETPLWKKNEIYPSRLKWRGAVYSRMTPPHAKTAGISVKSQQNPLMTGGSTSLPSFPTSPKISTFQYSSRGVRLQRVAARLGRSTSEKRLPWFQNTI